MSMSTHVIGLHPPDEKWQQMLDIWQSCCKVAGVKPPAEVIDFFDGIKNYPPDPKGVRVDLVDSGIATDFNEGYGDGYEIEIAKLPKSITHIRFYNSW